MGLFDEPLTEIKKACILDWDFSDAFPLDPEYTFKKGVVVVNGWPWQLMRQLEAKQWQQMTQPVISIITIDTPEEGYQLGDVYQAGVGQGQLQYRLGRRAAPSFLISCWADQQLGGMDMARKLGGQVYQAMLFNRNRLSTIRHLRLVHSHEILEDTAQLYRFDLVIDGDVHITLDV